MRMTRSSLLEVMSQDFVRTARAKVCPSERGVGPCLQEQPDPAHHHRGIQVGYLLGGAVVTRRSLPCPRGRLLLGAVVQRDYPLVQGTILFIAALFMLSNLVVDLLYAVIDREYAG